MFVRWSNTLFLNAISTLVNEKINLNLYLIFQIEAKMLTEREPTSLSLGRNGELPTLNIATSERMRLEEILDMCAGIIHL